MTDRAEGILTFVQEKPTEPMFSIIVPIYNTEAYLAQCVDSILGQRFHNFELVLVDDGSPDGSGAICDAYAAKDARVTVIHKENGGLVSARKAGAAVCRGNYVINVDSDDYIAPDLLERAAGIICTYSPSVVMFHLMRFSGDVQNPLCNRLPAGLYTGEGMSTIRENLIQDSNSELTLLYNLCAMVVERGRYISHQNAVPETISRGEDLVVTAPLLADCASLYIMDYYGYFYRSNPTSIMNTFRVSEIDQIKQLVSYLSERLDADYEEKLDVYTLTHYFDFLDRAMLRGFHTYRQIIRQTYDEELAVRIRRARTTGSLKLKLIFFLMRHRWYTALWVLRKIKKRQG